MSSQKNNLIYAAVGAAVALIVYLLMALSSPGHLYFKMSNDGNGEGEIYVDTGRGYKPEGVITLSLMPDGKTHIYGIDVRSSTPKSIRFDPGTIAGNIKIASVVFKSELYERHISCSDLRLLHALERSRAGGDECALTAVAGDPYFDFDIFSLNNIHINWIAIVEALAYSAITYLLIITFTRVSSFEVISQEKWLTNSRCIRLYLILAFGFLSFVFLKLHVSSVDEWGKYVSSNARSGVVLGASREIRSDEWMVSTPFYASQAANGFAVQNPSLGANGSALVTAVPVKGAYGYSQPRFWGFYLMEFDLGFSWLYAWRIFGLLLAGFVLLSILTRGDFWLSLTGSIWISISPFMQWWFGTNLPDMVIGLFGGVASLYLLIRASSLRNIIISSIVLYFSGISFVTALYPAFLIPIFYLGIFIVFGLFIRDVFDFSYIERWRSKVLFLILSLGGTLLIFWVWHTRAGEVISLVQNSIYPGHRVILGGKMSFSFLFSGIFGTFLRFDHFPLARGNVCEASNFLLLFPVAWVAMLARYKKMREIDPVAIAISLYILLILLWMFIGYPERVAKITMMSMSSEDRSLLGLGLASVLLTIYVFTTQFYKNKLKFDKAKRWIILSILFLALISVSLWLRYVYPDYVTWMRMALIIPVLMLWIISFFLGRKKWLIVLTMILILPGIAVNPLSHGLYFLRNSELSSVLMEDKFFGETKWLVIPDPAYAQLFKANGAIVWNGVRFISDPKEMQILDPTGRYRDIWYRYAHFSVSPLPLGAVPEFELKQTDTVLLKVDLCSDAINSLGINRFAFLTKPELNQFPCLEPMRQGPVARAWLYKKKHS